MALKALKAKVRSDSVPPAEPVAVTATSSAAGGGSSAASSSRPPARNREFVRGCVARLKQVELRLDVGCGDEWFRRLDGVDDLAGLAQQLEQLRRLTNLEEDADSAWLKVCAGGSVPDEQQSEFSRRLLRHLDDVDRAVPPMRRPVDMLGECILKYFDGHGIFMGTIVEYDEFTGFRLQYDDGDTEDVSLRDLRTLMTPITPPPHGQATNQADGQQAWRGE